MSLVCGKCHKSVEDHAHKDDQCSCISLFEENNTPMKEKDKVVTAEEFFREKIKSLYSSPKDITLSHEIITGEQGLRWAHEFAQIKVKEELDKKIKEIEQAWDECYQSLRYTIDLGEGGKFNEQQFDRYKKHFLDKIILDNKL